MFPRGAAALHNGMGPALGRATTRRCVNSCIRSRALMQRLGVGHGWLSSHSAIAGQGSTASGRQGLVVVLTHGVDG
jgi:hypothetical protein